MPETDRVTYEMGGAVRPAMRQRGGRLLDPLTAGWRSAARRDNADNATHCSSEVYRSAAAGRGSDRLRDVFLQARADASRPMKGTGRLAGSVRCRHLTDPRLLASFARLRPASGYVGSSWDSHVREPGLVHDRVGLYVRRNDATTGRAWRVMSCFRT